MVLAPPTLTVTTACAALWMSVAVDDGNWLMAEDDPAVAVCGLVVQFDGGVAPMSHVSNQFKVAVSVN